MVLSWLRRSWSERQAMKTEDLPAELSNALAWEGGTLDEHELLPEAADALPTAAGAAPAAASLEPESDITDALLAVLQEAEALPDSAANRLASTVDAVPVHELVSSVRGLRHRLDL